MLTDNEKSVTIEHVARIPVRNQQIVAFGRHYGVTVHTCQPREPASKGGVENAVKLAKADIVPTDTNLAEQYESFTALQDACTAFMAKVNHRVHSTTKGVPADMLTIEARQLHPVPEMAHTITFGETRQVAVNTPMVAYQGGSYSVRTRCWVKRCGSEPTASASAPANGSCSCRSGRQVRSRWPGTAAPSRAAPVPYGPAARQWGVFNRGRGGYLRGR